MKYTAPQACAVLVLVAVALPARAAPVQLTATSGDSVVQKLGPAGSGLVAITSSGDLTPGLPGNLDGAREVYLLRLANGSFSQITNSSSDSSAARITSDGLVVIASNGNLTPGLPGNVDGSFEAWLYASSAPTPLTQLTSSSGDTFFQTFWDDGGRAFFVSKGDLRPGAPGNADGQNEVYSYDVATKALTQLTNSPRQSLIRGICAPERCGIIESSGDLAPGTPGNADGSSEIYLLDLDTLALTQITASLGDTHYRGQDALGRYLAFESKGDLAPGAPGNADGSQEVFVYDRTKKTLMQATASAGDSYFDGFAPRSRFIVVDSNQDLATGKNADGSNEVFRVDPVSRRAVQQTRSAGDSYFGGFANSKNGLAAIISNGDLTGRTSAVGKYQAWRLSIAGKKHRAARLTNGTADSDVKGFDSKGLFAVIETTADLVAGKNVDGSNEVFVARMGGKPRIKQLTASTKDSSFAGFAGDGKSLLVNSRGDLVPTGVGNADGSSEVFRVSYR